MRGVRANRWAAGCGAVLTLGCLSACTETPTVPPAGAPSRQASSVENGPPPVERLSAGLAHMPQQGKGSRNPFRFRAEPREGAFGPGSQPDPAAYPELPLPLPQPAIRVLGVASDPDPAGGPPRRTAILSVGGELVLAPQGTLVAGRYRVTAIGEREVELVDQIDQHVERLALR